MIRAAFFLMALGSVSLFAAGEVGTTAASFNLRDLDSNLHSLSAYRGKIVFLSLFGGGCPTCISQAPRIERFHQKYKDKGVADLGLEIWNYSKSQVIAFKNNTGVTYPLLLLAGYLKSYYGVGYNTGYFVLDPQGIIRYSKNADYSTFDSVRVTRVVDSLLALQGTAAKAAPASASSIRLVASNPYRPGAVIRLEGYTGPAPLVTFFDLAGRVHAAPAAPGAYVVRVAAPGVSLSRRLALVP